MISLTAPRCAAGAGGEGGGAAGQRSSGGSSDRRAGEGAATPTGRILKNYNMQIHI